MHQELILTYLYIMIKNNKAEAVIHFPHLHSERTFSI